MPAAVLVRTEPDVAERLRGAQQAEQLQARRVAERAEQLGEERGVDGFGAVWHRRAMRGGHHGCCLAHRWRA